MIQSEPFEPMKVSILEHVDEIRLGKYTGNFVRKCRIIDGGTFDLFIVVMPTIAGLLPSFAASLKDSPEPLSTSWLLSGTWKEEPKWHKKLSTPSDPVSALMCQELSPPEVEGLSLVFQGDHAEGISKARYAIQRLAAYKPSGKLYSKTLDSRDNAIGEIFVKPLVVTTY